MIKQIVVVDQRFGSFVIGIAALDLAKLEIHFDQMGIFEFQQVVERDLLVERHAQDLRHRLFARKAFLFGIEPHIGADQLDDVLAVGPVHDSKRRGEIDMAAVNAQYQIGKRMKRPAGDLAAPPVHQ